jgi:hypothetical protein
MEAAGRAQAALVVSTEPLLAYPAVLTAISGMQALDAIAAMGLSVLEPNEEGTAE